jgi:hypothetical protein
MSCRVHFDAKTMDRDQWVDVKTMSRGQWKAVYRLWRIVGRRSQELLGPFGPGWTSTLFSQAGIFGTVSLYGLDRLANDRKLNMRNQWLLRAARYYRATGRSLDYWKRKILNTFPGTLTPGHAAVLPEGAEPLVANTAE